MACSALEAVSISKLEELLQCSICLGTVKDPRTLPCFHSYCMLCLKTFVKNHREKAVGRQVKSFHCPNCRVQFTLNPGEEVADMKRNHFICNMLEVMAVKDRVKGVPCSHCQKPSVGRCVDCEIFLCQECLTDHNKYRGFVNHSVLSMDDLAKPENQRKIRRKLHCQEHKKTMKFYCETCEELICRDCTDFNHEKPAHSWLPFEKVAEKQKQLLTESCTALEKKLKQGNQALRTVTYVTQSLAKVKERVKKDINARRDSILNAVTIQLNGKARSLMDQVDGIYSRKHDSLAKQKVDFQAYVEKVESCVSISKEILEKGTDEEILSSAKIMKENMEKVEKEIPETMQPNDDDKICYECGPRMTIDMAAVGKVCAEMGKVEYRKQRIAGYDNVSTVAESVLKSEKKIFEIDSLELERHSACMVTQNPDDEFNCDAHISMHPLLLRYIYYFHWNEFEELENVCKEMKFSVKSSERLLHLTAKDDLRVKFKNTLEKFITMYQRLNQEMHQARVSSKSLGDSSRISETRKEFSVIVAKCERDDGYLVYGNKDVVPKAVKFMKSGPAVSPSNSRSMQRNGSTRKSLSYAITPRTKIVVCEGDLTKEVVDVIVNPANKHLRHDGGAAGAIVKCGGKEIQDESFAVIKQYGNLAPGQVVYTGSGRLPCRHIIHAVGPVWSAQHSQQCRQALGQACFNSLLVACNLPGAQTIAIPAISSGLYGMPVNVCAEVLFDAVENFCKTRKNSEPMMSEIRFLNNKKEIVDAFEREMMKRYDPSVTREPGTTQLKEVKTPPQAQHPRQFYGTNRAPNGNVVQVKIPGEIKRT